MRPTERRFSKAEGVWRQSFKTIRWVFLPSLSLTVHVPRPSMESIPWFTVFTGRWSSVAKSTKYPLSLIRWDVAPKSRIVERESGEAMAMISSESRTSWMRAHDSSQWWTGSEEEVVLEDVEVDVCVVVMASDAISAFALLQAQGGALFSMPSPGQ